MLATALLAMCSIPQAAYALQPAQDADNEVYYEQNVADDEVYYEQNATEYMLMRERGRCTDVYSRGWCNAHGYKNNRPVGATVRLNAKEEKCVKQLYGSLAAALAQGVISVVTGSGGVTGYVAAASAAYSFWVCLG